MLTNVLTFGEYLTEWMEKHGHTCASLSEITGQKSRTTVSRLMHDQCSPQRCAVFITELITALPDIGEEELKRFRQSVDVSRYGKERYFAYQAFSALALPDTPSEAEDVSFIGSAFGEKLLSHLEEDNCEMLVLGCMDKRTLNAIRKILYFRSGSIKITQYFALQQCPDLTPLLSCILPLLHSPDYSLVSVEKTDSLTASKLVLQDAFVIKSPSGQKLIIPSGCKTVNAMKLAENADLMSFYENLLMQEGHLQSRYTVSYEYQTAEDYLNFLNQCIEYERNRTIFQIKPDLGTEHIPVDLLLANFRSFSAYSNAADIRAGEDALYRAFEIRHANLHSKRQPTYIFLNKNSMIDFAKTGVMVDHPACLRPFTPQERVQIFEYIIEQSRKNPYYFPLFLTNPDSYKKYSFVGYDKFGLLVYGLDTSYSQEDHYREILLTSPDIVDHFTNFALNVVLKSQVESLRSSIEFFQHLIRVASECM